MGQNGPMLRTRRLLVVAAATLAFCAVQVPRALAHTHEDPLHPGEDVSEDLEAVRAAASVPGMVAMALQDGEVIAWGAAGVRSIETKEPVSIDDPFHLGSCSKAMTSTLVAIYVEEGLLAWDTKIFEVLPELKEGADPGYADATIEHLVRHRAGIAERQRPEVAGIYAQFADLKGTPREQRIEVARLALVMPPHTKPGEAMDYSNYGYMTAAAMIERLTDRSWEELIVERLFVPLEMETAGVGSPYGEGVPVGHQPSGETWSAMAPGPAGLLHESMGPAGLLHSNLYDWGKFVSAHMAGARGDDGLVTAETVQRLQTDPAANAYAAGWGIGHRSFGWGEGKTISHNGSDGTWYSLVMAMPEWDLIVLIGVNSAGTGANTAATQVQEHLLKVAGFAE